MLKPTEVRQETATNSIQNLIHQILNIAEFEGPNLLEQRKNLLTELVQIEAPIAAIRKQQELIAEIE